jgi:hypothetical protein
MLPALHDPYPVRSRVRAHNVLWVSVIRKLYSRFPGMDTPHFQAAPPRYSSVLSAVTVTERDKMSVRQQRQPVRIKSFWLNIGSSHERRSRGLQIGLAIGGWVCFCWAYVWRMQAISAAEIDATNVLRF